MLLYFAMLQATLFALCVLTRAFPATAEDFPSLSNASLLWGPFRPNLYVGVRPRIPDSLLFGLMWSKANDPSDILKSTPMEDFMFTVLLIC